MVVYLLNTLAHRVAVEHFHLDSGEERIDPVPGRNHSDRSETLHLGEVIQPLLILGAQIRTTVFNPPGCFIATLADSLLQRTENAEGITMGCKKQVMFHDNVAVKSNGYWVPSKSWWIISLLRW